MSLRNNVRIKEVTDTEIAADYVRREEAMKAKLRGDFDALAIVTEMVTDLELPRSRIVAAILDNTFTEPN